MGTGYMLADLFLWQSATYVGVGAVNQGSGNSVGDWCFIEVELYHVALVPVPRLTDVAVTVDNLIELIGIPFQLYHIAPGECEAAEYLATYPKHYIIRPERHVFRGVGL